MEKPEITVVAALILEHGTVLIARKKPGKSLAGLWEFPGGKLEPGERLQDCLVREIKEELGVGIQAGEVFAETVHEEPERNIRLFGIEARCLDKRFVLADHDDIRMVRFRDLPRYPLAPADLPIAQKLIDTYGAV